MLYKKFGVISIIILVILVLGQVASAGTTGKIAGTVVDKSSGDPLQGANVMITGTSMGAATDENGNFTILNIQPGVYDLMVTVIGYTRYSVTELQVRIDQTTRVDVQLEPEALEGQTVTVVAERNVIKRDVSTSVVAIPVSEIENLPITTVDELVSLQAGVEEGLSIRGGGADEALFMVDGITLRDPRNNQPISTVAFSAVQEISLERGGFNAEYGNVRSGIINVVTKEGSKPGIAVP